MNLSGDFQPSMSVELRKCHWSGRLDCCWATWILDVLCSSAANCEAVVFELGQQIAKSSVMCELRKHATSTHIVCAHAAFNFQVFDGNSNPVRQTSLAKALENHICCISATNFSNQISHSQASTTIAATLVHRKIVIQFGIKPSLSSTMMVSSTLHRSFNFPFDELVLQSWMEHQIRFCNTIQTQMLPTVPFSRSVSSQTKNIDLRNNHILLFYSPSRKGSTCWANGSFMTTSSVERQLKCWTAGDST